MSKADHSRRPFEQPAVKTTIVGGRPPGPGKGLGEIPRGIEVLVKKASVDPDFRRLLLERRAEAAKAIELALEPAEAMMLNAVPAAQLEAIIAQTTVSPISRAAFLGKAAAVMLAALGAGVGCRDEPPPVTGIREGRPPERVPVTDGIRPDRPTEALQPEPASQAPAEPEQPAMPMAGAVARPVERTKPSTDRPTTKGIRPDRP